jgi:hypothetical protein
LVIDAIRNIASGGNFLDQVSDHDTAPMWFWPMSATVSGLSTHAPSSSPPGAENVSAVLCSNAGTIAKFDLSLLKIPQG